MCVRQVSVWQLPSSKASLIICNAGAGRHRLPEVRCAGNKACVIFTLPSFFVSSPAVPTQLLVTQHILLLAQSAAMFESRFNSVERIMAYNQLAQEAPATIEATQCGLVESH